MRVMNAPKVAAGLMCPPDTLAVAAARSAMARPWAMAMATKRG